MKYRFATLTALSTAAILTLSACGSSGGTQGMDMGTESSAASAPSSTASAEATASSSADAMAEHNDADVMFAQMMLPHHTQAVEMSDMLLEKEGIDPAVTDLATRIKEAQGPEIDQLTAWLEAWGEPMEMTEEGMKSMETMDSGMGSMDSMEGMMSDEDMTALSAAEGTEAETMFLESMTAHHQGAIEMAKTEVQDGMFPDAVTMAETIIKTQQAEIDEMTALLAQK